MIAAIAALSSYWRRNPVQWVTLMAGLALATALWSGVQAINAEARASYDAAAAVLGEDRYDQLLPRSGDSLPLSDYITLRRAGWQVSPVIDGQVETETGRVRLVGVEPMTAPRGVGLSLLSDAPDLPEVMAAGTVFAHPAAADALSAVVPNPVRTDPGMAPDTALADISVVAAILKKRDRLSRLIVVEPQPMGPPPLTDIAPNLTRRAAQGGAEVGRLTDSFHLNLTAFGLLSFAVGIFIVHGAIGLAFEQRRPLIRTLRAVGVPLRTVVILLAAELAVMAFIAGALGVLGGYGIAALLLPDVAATLKGLYGAQVSGSLQLRADWWLSGLAIALGGATLAGASALWRIARMPLLASPGGRAWAMASGAVRRWQAGAGLGLLVVAACLAVAQGGLLLAFTCLPALLLGAALTLPALLSALIGVAQRLARIPLWQWFWADTRQQLPGLSLALMALLLAASANVGVSTMVSSFRLTFVGFLDQRLAAELYVQAEDEAQAAALEPALIGLAEEVMPLLYVDTTLAGHTAELYGARVGRTYPENWGFVAASPQPWAQVKAGQAVIVNEQLARRAGLWVGDDLTIAEGQSLPIAGVFGDYGNPIGQAVIGEDLFTDLYPDTRATRFGVRTDDVAGLRATLTDQFNLPEANMINQSQIKAFSLSVFERTFTVTAALNILTLAVAGFAMLMSLLTLSTMRLPQLAPVWALGLTRARLGALELLRAVMLAVLTLIVALPLGLALAWVLLAMVNVEAFGWRLPMFLFPLDYARLGGLAILAAGLAALWPARRLARTPPADLLKVFARER